MTDPWSFACPDWFERLQAGRSLVPDLPLDDEEAERVVTIFDKLRLPDVKGKCRTSRASRPWRRPPATGFRDFIRAAFGSLDSTGRRQVAEIFALVGKKNSKTTGGAGIILTARLMPVTSPVGRLWFTFGRTPTA